MEPRAFYSAFDVFPSPKGASTHIRQMAATLFDFFSGGMLYVLGDSATSERLQEENILIYRETFATKNYLTRALEFSNRLGAIFSSEQDPRSFKLIHFRDAWSGKTALDHCSCPSIYEVNGLPSIELQTKYLIPVRTIEKIRQRELECLHRATRIITPAHTIARCLRSLGINDSKIDIISNGADIPPTSAKPAQLPERYAVYFGALQRWQGVENLLRAFSLLRDRQDFSLVICSSSHPRVAKPYRKLAERLGISSRLHWQFGLSQELLHPVVSHAAFSVAPLSDCPRNSFQGCCPLKILESLAAGTPVIASRLPCVEELLQDGEHGLLVRPDRPSELARSMRIALEYPDVLAKMGEKAQAHIRERYRWSAIRDELRHVYQLLSSSQRDTSFGVTA